MYAEPNVSLCEHPAHEPNGDVKAWVHDTSKTTLWNRVRPTLESLALRVTPSTVDSAALMVARLLEAYDSDPWARVPADFRGLPFEVCPIHAIHWEFQPILGGQWVIKVRDNLWATHAPWQHMVPPSRDADQQTHDAYAQFCVAGARDDDYGVFVPGKQLVFQELMVRSMLPLSVSLAQRGGSLGYTRDIQPGAGASLRVLTRTSSLLKHIDIATDLWEHTDHDLHKLEGPLSYISDAVTRNKIISKTNEIGLKHRFTSSFQSESRGGSDQNTAPPDFCQFDTIDDLIAEIVIVVVEFNIHPTCRWVCPLWFAKWDISDCFHIFPTRWRDGDACTFLHPVLDRLYRMRFFPFGPTNGPARAFDFSDGVKDGRRRGFGATPISIDGPPRQFGPDPPARLVCKVDDYVSVHISERLAREVGLGHGKGLVHNLGAETKDAKDRVVQAVDYDGFILTQRWTSCGYRR